jgi:uncharacterized phiE125 gp8 family phage protein
VREGGEVIPLTPIVIAPPVDEPLTIDECRAHLEAQIYNDSDVDALDDEMILAWLGAAREACENFLGLSLSRRILEVALDTFPNETDDGTTAIELPGGPVVEIVSIYVGEPISDTAESDFLLTVDDYLLDVYRRPTRLLPVGTWPTGTGANSIKIRYDAGYGVDSDGGEPLPKAARAAMLLILGDLFANREDSTEKQLYSMPNSAENLLRPMRVKLGMA